MWWLHVYQKVGQSAIGLAPARRMQTKLQFQEFDYILKAMQMSNCMNQLDDLSALKGKDVSLTHLHTYIIYIHILSAASARMGWADTWS